MLCNEFIYLLIVNNGIDNMFSLFFLHDNLSVLHISISFFAYTICTLFPSLYLCLSTLYFFSHHIHIKHGVFLLFFFYCLEMYQFFFFSLPAASYQSLSPPFFYLVDFFERHDLPLPFSFHICVSKEI